MVANTKTDPRGEWRITPEQIKSEMNKIKSDNKLSIEDKINSLSALKAEFLIAIKKGYYPHLKIKTQLDLF